MKRRIKKLPMMGEFWDVIYTKERDSRIDGEDRTIYIGTEYPKEISENLVHEIVEGLLMVRGWRYVNHRNEIIFTFNHENLSNFCIDLLAVIRQIKDAI